ncbi:MAG: tetratricopeptide repeat protein [Pyrinomonadaceae bacterium]
MSSKSIFTIFATLALVFSAVAATSAQTGELRGHVLFTQADGKTIPASEAGIDVYRTDLPGKYTTKANKKGEFVFAGLPFVGTYVIAASHPTAQPTWVPNVKVGRGVDYEVKLSPGDGKRLTLDEIKAGEKIGGGGGGTASGATTAESASDKAKREELIRKNTEIESRNKKVEESNSLVTRTFKAGNDFLSANKYDEAIAQYNEGLNADPDHPGVPSLLTNKAVALKARGIDRYNTAIKASDDAAKKAGMDSAKKDWQESAESATKAVNLLKAQSNPDPLQPGQKSNLYYALAARADAMKFYVPKVDPAQVDQGIAAFQEYIPAESDAIKKGKAEHDLAQMLFDANDFDKALAEYQKILTANPDDLEALLRSGQALFNIGAINSDKAKYQEAANFLARFVEKAPDTNALKADAKAILEALKDQENVKPEKTPTSGRPPRRRP